MIWGHFWKRYRKTLGYLVLFAFPFGALFIDEVRIPKTLIVQKINSWFVHPIAESIHNSVGGVTYIFKNYFALRKVKEANDVLAKENDRLKLEIIQLKETSVENTRLSALLEMKKEIKQDGKIARVIGEDASPDRFTYLINIGKKDGVEPRSPVLTSLGIVGQIREVFDHSSLVITLLDPSSIVDAVDTRSRSHALVEGTGKDYLAKTKFVDRIEDFRVGDLMLSSGIDGVFPKGYPIGTIIEVQKPALGVLQTSFLRPAVDYDKLEEVLVFPPISHEPNVQVSIQGKGQATAR
jgi:rod shape-determining protein MreC